MLKIEVPIGEEYYDYDKEEFILPKMVSLQLEHSLVSLHKWESKWKKPFYSRKEKTIEETIDYVKCMTMTQHVDPEVYTYLTPDNLKQINSYIDDTMTATTFAKDNGKASNEVITAEIIYYWMMSSGISYECRKWHLNQLLTLIRVFSVKSSPSKKMSKSELMSRNRSLNAARKAQLNTRG